MTKISLPAFNQTKAWVTLQGLSRMKDRTLIRFFSSNPQRASEFSIATPHIFMDYSRQRLCDLVISSLVELAGERQLPQQIQAMFSGEKINATEGRAVLHTALRQQGDTAIFVDSQNIIPAVHSVLSRVEMFSNQVHDGQRLGVTGKRIKNIVAVGIGGSYLGPEYLAEACAAYAKDGMRLRFVANVDGTDFVRKTQDLDPAETLFVIISKTITTAETMKNAETAKQWVQATLGASPEVIEKHFVAVSTAEDRVKAFGINLNNTFGFWDWVGGRYSATSAVGAVPLSLFLGYERFSEILRGAEWMDQHFLTAPIRYNIPIMAALIDIWNINFMGWPIRALLPYAQAYAKLPAHTQQVEMESNGKLVDRYGRPIDFQTGEVVFGEPGTNGQHSFYQLIHQGAQIIPCTFIGFIRPQYKIGQASAAEVTHHQELMTNFLAQPDALAFGQESSDPAKNFPGNRPSTSLLLERQNPFAAGLLLAYIEHVAAAKGFLWGINSFDQFGVELGKVLGKNFRGRMEQFNAGNGLNTGGLNLSSAILLQAVLVGRLPQ